MAQEPQHHGEAGSTAQPHLMLFPCFSCHLMSSHAIPCHFMPAVSHHSCPRQRTLCRRDANTVIFFSSSFSLCPLPPPFVAIRQPDDPTRRRPASDTTPGIADTNAGMVLSCPCISMNRFAHTICTPGNTYVHMYIRYMCATNTLLSPSPRHRHALLSPRRTVCPLVLSHSCLSRGAWRVAYN